MNIEEGIEILKNSKKLYLKEKVDSDILEQAIETLLTAYEEKEERCNFLDKELYNANQEIQDLQLNIEKQSKEIEELKDKYSDEKIRNTVIKRYREVIEKDYISKDKIKAKIEEYEKMKEATKMDTTYYGEKRRSVIEGLIAELQSLLEKE